MLIWMKIIVVLILRIPACFFGLFMIGAKKFLYPYTDIGGDFWIHVVDLDSLGARLLLALCGITIETLSIIILISCLLKKNRDKGIKKLIIIMLLVSTMSLLLFTYRYTQFRYISSSLTDCEVEASPPGCYIPTWK